MAEYKDEIAPLAKKAVMVEDTAVVQAPAKAAAIAVDRPPVGQEDKVNTCLLPRLFGKVTLVDDSLGPNKAPEFREVRVDA